MAVTSNAVQAEPVKSDAMIIADLAHAFDDDEELTKQIMSQMKWTHKAAANYVRCQIHGMKPLESILQGVSAREALLESKFSWDGKYLKMPEGEMSSFPHEKDRDTMVLVFSTNSEGMIKAYQTIKGSVHADIANKYDRDWDNIKEFVKFLNSNKARYVGVDHRL